MENKLERLLNKYWEGETTLEEEREIRILLRDAEGFDAEKKFFLGIKEISDQQPREFYFKTKTRKSTMLWFRIAALFIIFLTVGSVVYRYQEKKAEKEAFEQVMQAFNLIQTNMQKGTQSLGAMEEFRHLNTTQEIFNIKESRQ